jgi:molybdenum cofactor guanylyltransferase
MNKDGETRRQGDRETSLPEPSPCLPLSLSPRLSCGAIILCGGRSTRMGRDKASLPFGDESLLERVVRIVANAVPAERIVCVAAQGQTLPALPDGLRIVRDPLPDCGPLAGLATGLGVLSGEVDAAFVGGCDVPLLLPPFIERMFELSGGHQTAVVDDGARSHPLCAVYRSDVRRAAEEILAAGGRSLMALVDACDSIRISPEQLRDVDPDLRSLAACNTPEEFSRAMSQANVAD